MPLMTLKFSISKSGMPPTAVSSTEGQIPRAYNLVTDICIGVEVEAQVEAGVGKGRGTGEGDGDRDRDRDGTEDPWSSGVGTISASVPLGEICNGQPYSIKAQHSLLIALSERPWPSIPKGA